MKAGSSTEATGGVANLLGELRRHGLVAAAGDGEPLVIAASEEEALAGDRPTVVALRRLQDVADYRAALRRWFAALRVGGHLVVTVPHAFLYERQIALPSRRHPGQRRLYTPGSLLDEVEEALVPNSYRLRRLCDRDTGYDYRLDPAEPPVGAADILLVLERIAPPTWGLIDEAAAAAAGPDFGFEPPTTRVEHAALVPKTRVLILKLDHLGDFLLALPALERARAVFAGAEITLVVGSWNAALARQHGIADQVIAFDGFPRNSLEQEPDIRGTRTSFEERVTGEYDIAIDLRGDRDSRFLLRSVRTGLRAGMGSRAEFPFLDIALPLDPAAHEREIAGDERIAHDRFLAQPGAVRGAYRIAIAADRILRDSAVIWGPYAELRPGRYIFEPFVEIDPHLPGLLHLDIGLDRVRAAELIPPMPSGDGGALQARLEFTVERPRTVFEFRIWTVPDAPVPGFSFFGGRLLREGTAGVLHQSEALLLLIELVALRVDRFGLLREGGPPA